MNARFLPSTVCATPPLVYHHMIKIYSFPSLTFHGVHRIFLRNTLRFSSKCSLSQPPKYSSKYGGNPPSSELHPRRLTWNIIMEVWKIIFLSKWVICRFHVNLPGCINPPKKKNKNASLENQQQHSAPSFKLQCGITSAPMCADFPKWTFGCFQK